MKVFICWSGRKSLSWTMARVLHTYLLEIMEEVDPWMSEKDIMAGSSWQKDLMEALSEAEFCVVCLAPQSLHSRWMTFEVGFIANALGESSVCPYLIGLSPEEIADSPLSFYQSKTADKEGTWDLILAIARKQHGERPLYEKRLKSRFEFYWEKALNEEFKRLLAEDGTPQHHPERREPIEPEPTEHIESRPHELTEPKSSKSIEPEPPTPSAAETQKRIIRPVEPKEGTEPESMPAFTESMPPFRLWLFNTSFYSRKGYAMHDWQSIFNATGIPSQEVVVRDEKGNELPSQVDYFEHSDPTQATLVFSLLNEIPPVSEDYSVPSSYVTIERGTPKQWPNQPLLKVEDPGHARRVKLINNRLEIILELKPKPWQDKDKEW